MLTTIIFASAAVALMDRRYVKGKELCYVDCPSAYANGVLCSKEPGTVLRRGNRLEYCDGTDGEWRYVSRGRPSQAVMSAGSSWDLDLETTSITILPEENDDPTPADMTRIQRLGRSATMWCPSFGCTTTECYTYVPPGTVVMYLSKWTCDGTTGDWTPADACPAGQELRNREMCWSSSDSSRWCDCVSSQPSLGAVMLGASRTRGERRGGQGERGGQGGNRRGGQGGERGQGGQGGQGGQRGQGGQGGQGGQQGQSQGGQGGFSSRGRPRGPRPCPEETGGVSSCTCMDGTSVSEPRDCGRDNHPTSCSCSDGSTFTPPERGSQTRRRLMQ